MRPARRLLLGLGLVSLLPPLLTLAGQGWLLKQRWSEERRQRMERAVRLVREHLTEVEGKLATALDGLLRQRQVENLLVEMIRGGSEIKPAVDWAQEWREARNLELLTLLDGQGRVLSCGHLPARFGERDSNLLQAAAGGERKLFLRREALLEGNRIQSRMALVMVAQRRFEDAAVVLMAGELLEGANLQRLETLAEATLALIDAEGKLLAASGQRQVGEKWLPGEEEQSERVSLPPALGDNNGGAQWLISISSARLKEELVRQFFSVALVALVGWLLAWWLGWLWLRAKTE